MVHRENSDLFTLQDYSMYKAEDCLGAGPKTSEPVQLYTKELPSLWVRE